MEDEHGMTVGGVLLFVHQGELAELEAYYYEEPRGFPAPDRITVFVRERPTGG